MTALSTPVSNDVAWILEEFPARVREARVAHGLEAAELAVMVGISLAEFARLECGTHAPRPTVLVNLARVLHVSVAWFLGETDDPIPEEEEEPPAGSIRALWREGPAALEAAIRARPPETDMDEFRDWEALDLFELGREA